MSESKFFEQPQGEKKEKIDILKAEMVDQLKKSSSKELYEACDRLGLKVPSFADMTVRTEEGEEWEAETQRELIPQEIEKELRYILINAIGSTVTLSETKSMFQKLTNKDK